MSGRVDREFKTSTRGFPWFTSDATDFVDGSLPTLSVVGLVNSGGSSDDLFQRHKTMRFSAVVFADASSPRRDPMHSTPPPGSRRGSHSDRTPEMAARFGRNLYFAVAALMISATRSSTFHSLPVKTLCTLPCASTTTVRRL